MLLKFFWVFSDASSPQTRLKATIVEGIKKKKMIKHENNSGELDAGIDIPLVTVQIVGWGKHPQSKESQRDAVH